MLNLRIILKIDQQPCVLGSFFRIYVNLRVCLENPGGSRDSPGILVHCCTLLAPGCLWARWLPGEPQGFSRILQHTREFTQIWKTWPNTRCCWACCKHVCKSMHIVQFHQLLTMLCTDSTHVYKDNWTTRYTRPFGVVFFIVLVNLTETACF